MFQYECKQKVQFWGFQTLDLPWNLCAETQYCTIHEGEQPLRSGCLSLCTPLYGGPGWLGFQGREDTICIFRARTDLFIPILMPKKTQRNLCWWLLGSIPVSFSPENAKCYPFHSNPWFDQASPCRDSCPWPSLPSPGSVQAMVTHVQTLHPDFLRFPRLSLLELCILPLLSPTKRFGKISAILDNGQMPGQCAQMKLGGTYSLF